ncbi:MAG: YfjI family protein [Oscillospiraceae bacterium]|nr:YfjI family protein [Oscillospiraceae bacterium]
MNKETYSYDEWEQPIPLDSIEQPEFPINSLPSVVRNYVLAVSEATQTPIDMAGVVVLAVMATCVQGKYVVEGKPDWVEQLSLYSIVIAKPGERKSPVLRLMTKPLYEYEKEWNEENELNIERGKLEKRILEKEVNDLDVEFTKSGSLSTMNELLRKREELLNFDELQYLRLLADDVTPEALVSLMVKNRGKISIISSEGGIFEILQGRYSKSPNIDAILKAHFSEPIRIDRVGREHERIDNPNLTILLTVQPQVIEGLMSNEIFRGRGLVARFLYSYPASKVGNRKYDTEPIPDKYVVAYKELCYKLLDLPNASNRVLKLSSKAHSLSEKFANKCEPRFATDLENMAEFATKLHGSILRIAGILHLICGNTEEQYISEDTLKKAIDIGVYYMNHAKVVYQLMGIDEQTQDAKYVLQQIKSNQNTELTTYGIFRICRGKFNKCSDLIPALELLTEYGYLKEVEVEYKNVGRRSRPKYLINPHIYG